MLPQSGSVSGSSASATRVSSVAGSTADGSRARREASAGAAACPRRSGLGTHEAWEHPGACPGCTHHTLALFSVGLESAMCGVCEHVFVLRSCETMRKERAADMADGRRRERIRMHRLFLDARGRASRVSLRVRRATVRRRGPAPRLSVSPSPSGSTPGRGGVLGFFLSSRLPKQNDERKEMRVHELSVRCSLSAL